MIASLSKDIQSAGSDTRPTMLDRSNFESWQQRIHLYCKVKHNGENILQSIDKGLFQMGKFRETITDGALGPEQDRVFKDLIPEENERITVQNVQGRQNRGQENNAKGAAAAGNRGNSKYFKDKMLMMQAQENGVVLNEEQQLFIAVDQCDAFDSNVDEAPTAQTMFMANLSSVDPIYDEAGPSYDSNVISEVHDHDNYLDSFENVTALQEQNERLREENEKVKQHYKELYNSIKITCVKNIEKASSLLTENEKLKARLKGKIECFTINTVKQKVFALEYVFGTCLKEFSKRDTKVATTPLNRIKQVTFKETCGTSNKNTQAHVEHEKVKKTNVHVIPSTRVNSSTKASGLTPKSNTKKNRILPAKSEKEKKIKDHPRNNKSNLKKENRVDSSIRYKRTRKPTTIKFTLGEQFPLTRFTKSKVVPLQQPEHISSSEIMITGRFCNTSQKPLTRRKRRNKKEKAISTGIPTTALTRPIDARVVHIVLWYLDSRCSKHMTKNRSRFKNFMKKFIGTVRFGNDHFVAIMGYEDYMIGDNVISRDYPNGEVSQIAFIRVHILSFILGI
nr:integrase, catalytic region, zinc finger, CCHC-type, peptidase aspartic, catalytic [Tanacetum cinerariifolium]